jgi:DNA-binding response OmpR family regulator
MARILIIDDEFIIRDLLVNILEREGYETITAASGKDGMKIQQQNPADLIIIDIIMPEKEGLETIMELRRNFHDVKIIAMSGGGRIDSETYLQIAKTMGAIKTITKPIYRKEILKTVRGLLE